MATSQNHDLIAGWKSTADWVQTRAALVVGQNPDKWGAAFDEFFLTRLDLRYRNPINLLQGDGKYRGEGFSILTLQCSLIEYLESALQGKNYKYLPKGKTSGQWEYSKSQGIFVSFLCTRPPFDSHFDRPLAKDFYQNVRCGLLHEARTKGGWLVHARDFSDLDAIVDRKQKIVFRDGFQRALDKFVGWYRSELLINAEIQQAFIRKFDNLCI